MTQLSGNIDDFGMCTATLAGPLEARLRAVREAGFSQVMLDARDIVDHPQGLEAAVAAVRASGLRVTGLQTLRDFEGLTGQLHDYKVDMAKALLEMAAALGAPLLLASSSVSPHASDDPQVIARDLRKLAILAVPLGIRVAYQALSWGRVVSQFTAAWDMVCRADVPNLGLAIDSLHALAAETALDDLEFIDSRKIFLVQLADFMWQEARTVDERMATATRQRVFPGEGAHSVQVGDLVSRLAAIGYRGDYCLDVFNDDYRQMPLAMVADRARRSAAWLGEEVLQRSVPLPNAMRLKGRGAIAG